MASISSFEDLVIWQSARIQAQKIFELYSQNRFCNDFEFFRQINSSSGSVMDNIAEGFERSGNREFKNFLLYSKGSNGEVRSQLYRAADRNYINESEFREMLEENKKLSSRIAQLIKHVIQSEKKGLRYE